MLWPIFLLTVPICHPFPALSSTGWLQQIMKGVLFPALVKLFFLPLVGFESSSMLHCHNLESLMTDDWKIFKILLKKMPKHSTSSLKAEYDCICFFKLLNQVADFLGFMGLTWMNTLPRMCSLQSSITLIELWVCVGAGGFPSWLWQNYTAEHLYRV